MHRPTFFWYNGAEYTLLENIMTIFEELKARGLIFQTTDEEALVKAFEEGPVSYYTGYDPTADSLHLGHLVAILTSRRLQLAGHKPYALVGGATGLIGDPSFKDAERSLQTKETVEGWVEKIQGQLSRFLDFENGDNKAVMVNNYDWFGSVSFIDFLRDVGKYFTVNYMMSKESVKKRIETGISYTEFAYQIMQGYDFYELNDKYGVTLQIGGSDQWGNITTGAELIRRTNGGEVFALVCPLVTKADGTKFGKTEKGNIWLNRDYTSPYAFYQFWLNVADDDAKRYIRIFTTLDKEEIDGLIAQHDEDPGQRILQKRLAKEITIMVHSEEDYNMAVEASNILFGKATKESLTKLDEQTLLDVFAGVPQFEVSREVLSAGIKAVDLTAEMTQCFPSKGEMRKMVQGGGVSLNKEKLTAFDRIVTADDLLNGKYLLVQRGKKNYFLLIAK